MIATAAHEAEVARCFDRQAGRFRPLVDPDDFRLRAVLAALGGCDGLRILDLGCGQGRFAARLREAGAFVVGLDRSAAMLGRARDRTALLLGTARRLPFADGAFDAVVAIEVIEHLDPAAVDELLDEARRVLRPGGRLLILDKNAASLDPNRPWLPALAVKRLDERRGLWMYPGGGPVRERWFWPGRLRAHLARTFADVTITRPIAPDERRWAVFRAFAGARRFVLWSAARPGGAA